MDYKGWIFSVLIAILVFVAFGSTYIEDLAPTYHTNVSTVFSSAYNKTAMDTLVTDVTVHGTNISDAALAGKNLDGASDPVKDQYKTIRFIFASGPIVKSMILTTADVLHIPPIIINILIAIIVFTLAFFFLNALFGWLK
jgi:hypothetical protein